jgi:hypothetical protein
MWALLTIMMLAALGGCDCDAEKQEAKKRDDEFQAKRKKFSFILRTGIPISPDPARARIVAADLDIVIGRPLKTRIRAGFIELWWASESYSMAHAWQVRAKDMLSGFEYKTGFERDLKPGEAFLVLEERCEV